MTLLLDVDRALIYNLHALKAEGNTAGIVVMDFRRELDHYRDVLTGTHACRSSDFYKIAV